MKKTKKLPIVRFNGVKKEKLFDRIVTETPITILLNDLELATIICTPESILDLVTRFLFTERLIKKKEDMIETEYDKESSIVKVTTKNLIDPVKDLRNTRFITPGCVSPGSFYNASDSVLCKKVESILYVSPEEIIKITKQAQKKSVLFNETGGVHSAALYYGSKLIFFIEDIGRHNALDKIFGRCILNGINLDDKIILTSGRISSAVILKIIKAPVPILISRSAPTAAAVDLAKEFGITLIGFARSTRFNVYSHIWRIKKI